MSADFVSPESLPSLLLVPVLWLVLRGLDRARLRRVRRLVGPRATVLAGELSHERRRLGRWLTIVGVGLALVALLQPRFGEGEREVDQRGVDVVVCLDVSRSMRARDLAPDRLERARAEVRAVTQRVRGDRVALVAFAGEAKLVAPLTRDMESLAALLELVDPLSVGRGGTDLGAALETALHALGAEAGEHSVILLLTDGEDHAGRGLRIAERCRALSVTVHCVGFGSARGSKIPDPEGEGFVRDRSGREVVSAMDPASLRRIAGATGGDWVDATAREGALMALHRKRVAPLARKAFASERRRTRKNRYQWPLLAAFVLWILGLGLGERKR